jgi:predicted nucleic acid-binding protein
VNAARRGPTVGAPAVLADTGVLYAATDPSDQYHERAQEQLHRIEQLRMSVVVCYPTVLEAYSLIVQRLGPASAAAWFKQMHAGAGFITSLPEDYELSATTAAQSFGRCARAGRRAPLIAHDPDVSAADPVAGELAARQDPSLGLPPVSSR